MTITHSPKEAKPPDYHHTLHPVVIIKRVVLHLVFLLMALIGISWLVSLGNSTGYIASGAVIFVILPIIWFLIYRQYWRWKNAPIVCSPESGQIKIHEPINRWLGIRGSTPDPIDLDEYTLKSETQSIWETYLPWLHSSQTITLTKGEKEIAIKNIVHAEKLEAIQEYIKGLKRRASDQNDRLIELAEEQVELTDKLIHQHGVIISLLNEIASSLARQNDHPLSDVANEP